MSDPSVIESDLIMSGSPRGSRDGVLAVSSENGKQGSEKLAEEITKRQIRLEHLRESHDALWTDVDTYVTSRRARWNIGTQKGAADDFPIGSEIYDGTSTAAIRDFVDQWQAQTANAVVKWWGGRFRNAMLRGMYSAKRWMDAVEEALSYEMANSNFYEQLNEAFADGTSHGVATMVGPEWDARRNKFYTLERHPREVFIATDWRGEVNLWHRKFVLTGRQILAQFGERPLTEKLVEQIRKNPYREYTIIHAIFERMERDITSPLRSDLPWASVWVMEKERIVLDEGGYTEMETPQTWRWHSSASYPYGTCPAIDAIMDVLASNSATKSLLYAAQLAVRPPVIQTENLGDFDLVPDGRIILKNGATDKVQAFQYPTQFNIGVEQISALRNDLKERFRANMGKMQSQLGGKITAFQASLVQGEQAAASIPITSRASDQLLVPMVNKFFHAAAKAGRIPAPPPEVMQYASSPVDIQMMGPMAVSAKRFLSQQGLAAFLGILEEIDKVMPGVGQQIAKTVNGDELRKFITDGDGTPNKIFFTDEQIAAMRQQEAQMVQAQQKQAALGQMADMYNKATEAPQQGSPAQQLMGGQQS